MTPAASLRGVVRTYSLFLRLVSDHFSAAARKHSGRCKTGCHTCCSSGLFSISLLDALHLSESLRHARASVRKRVVANANAQMDLLERNRISSRANPFLRSTAARDRLASRSSGMRCPALDHRNRCLIYEHRPLLCRIFGPVVRGGRRAVLLDGCGAYAGELPEADFPVLSIYKDEDVLLKALADATGVQAVRTLSTIIPAALATDLGKMLRKR